MCYFPIHVFDKKRKENRTVPCGKCSECLVRLRQDKFIRIREEMKSFEYTSFATLTYSDENLVWGVNPTLCKRDIQLFMKRLRKSLRGIKIKYYIVGEYGTRYKRPHYHMVIMGLSKEACDVYIRKAWSKGNVHIGQLNDRSINYVCKYHVLRGKHPYGTEKCFSLSSNGIGMSYVKQLKKWHKEHVLERSYYQLDQYKKPLPRYIEQKIYNEFDLKVLKRKRKKFLEDRLVRYKNVKEVWDDFNKKKIKDSLFKIKSEEFGSL